MTKYFLVVALQLLLAIATSAQTSKYASTNLNIRSGPSSSDKVLVTIPVGTSVEMAEDCDCKWIMVSYNGTIGFVSSKYLTNQRITEYSGNSRYNGFQKINLPAKYYRNSSGQKVQSPTYYKSAPAGATALCRDGTYSFSRNRRGTCSHHGGVARWL